MTAVIAPLPPPSSSGWLATALLRLLFLGREMLKEITAGDDVIALTESLAKKLKIKLVFGGGASDG